MAAHKIGYTTTGGTFIKSGTFRTSMETSSLKEAGLTDGEIKVYLALLELGPSTAGPVIERARVAKSIVYIILEKLIEKGLVSYIIKEKTRQFQAAEPSKILDYIDERKEKMEKNRRLIEHQIPQLMLLKSLAKKTTVQVYEGYKGIQTAYEHLYLHLKRGDVFVLLGIPSFQEERYHLYWQRDHLRRAKAGISARLLFNQGTDASILKNRNSYSLCEARYMPTDIQTPSWILCYKDHTIIVLQSKKAICIEIEDPDIASSFQSYFDHFWKMSKSFVRKQSRRRGKGRG